MQQLVLSKSMVKCFYKKFTTSKVTPKKPTAHNVYTDGKNSAVKVVLLHDLTQEPLLYLCKMRSVSAYLAFKML